MSHQLAPGGLKLTGLGNTATEWSTDLRENQIRCEVLWLRGVFESQLIGVVQIAELVFFTGDAVRKHLQAIEILRFAVKMSVSLQATLSCPLLPMVIQFKTTTCGTSEGWSIFPIQKFIRFDVVPDGTKPEICSHCSVVGVPVVFQSPGAATDPSSAR